MSRVTLKIDGWPCKTSGHLFRATSSCVYYFVAIGEFKLGLQSRNTQNSKSAIFVLCDLEIWQMTLKINTAPILCHFNLCASFHSHCQTRLQKCLEILKIGMDQYSSIGLGYFLLWTEIIAQAVVWEELLNPPNRMALVVTILSVTNAV